MSGPLGAGKTGGANFLDDVLGTKPPKPAGLSSRGPSSPRSTPRPAGNVLDDVLGTAAPRPRVAPRGQRNFLDDILDSPELEPMPPELPADYRPPNVQLPPPAWEVEQQAQRQAQREKLGPALPARTQAGGPGSGAYWQTPAARQSTVPKSPVRAMLAGQVESRTQRAAREGEQLERERQHRASLLGIPLNMGDLGEAKTLPDFISALSFAPARLAGQILGEVGQVGSRLVAPALNHWAGDFVTKILQQGKEAAVAGAGHQSTPAQQAALLTPRGLPPTAATRQGSELDFLDPQGVLGPKVRAWLQTPAGQAHLARQRAQAQAEEQRVAGEQATAALQGDAILGPRGMSPERAVAEQAGRARVAAAPDRNWMQELSGLFNQVVPKVPEWVPGVGGADPAYMFDQNTEDVFTQQLRRNPGNEAGALLLDMLASPNPLAMIPGGQVAKLPAGVRTAANLLGAGAGAGSELPVLATKALTNAGLDLVRSGTNKLAGKSGRAGDVGKFLGRELELDLAPSFDLEDAIAAGAREALEPGIELDQAVTRSAEKARQAQRVAQEAAREAEIARLEHQAEVAADNLQANLAGKRGMQGLNRVEQRLTDQAEVDAALRELEDGAEPDLVEQLLAQRNRLKTAEELRQQRQAGGWRPTFEDDPGVAEARALQQGQQGARQAERELEAELAQQRRLEQFEELAARQQRTAAQEAPRSGLLGPRGEPLDPGVSPWRQLELPEAPGPRRPSPAREAMEPHVTPEELPQAIPQRNLLDDVLGTEPPTARGAGAAPGPRNFLDDLLGTEPPRNQGAPARIAGPDYTDLGRVDHEPRAITRERLPEAARTSTRTTGTDLQAARQVIEAEGVPSVRTLQDGLGVPFHEGKRLLRELEGEGYIVRGEQGGLELRQRENSPPQARAGGDVAGGTIGPARAAGNSELPPAGRATDRDWDNFDQAVGDLQASIQQEAIAAGRGRSNPEVVRANELARTWKEDLPGWAGRVTDDQVEEFAKRARELEASFPASTARRKAVQEMFEAKTPGRVAAPSGGRQRSLRGYDLADTPAPASSLSQTPPGSRETPAAAPVEPLPAPYSVAGQRIQIGSHGVSRRVSIPGLVRLVRELTGQVPHISEGLKKLSEKVGSTVRGRFIASGKRAGQLELNPDIFRDPDTAARVLAHEVGHLVDWFPDQTTKRGNLVARVASLRNFMKASFHGLFDKELRRELEALSRWWRPFDEASASKEFIRYRQSAEELYADALSVMFNDADEFQRRAPRFAQAFFEHLDKKPEVKAAMVQLHDWMSGTMDDVVSDVRGDLRAGFVKAEDLWRGLREEAEARKSSGWERFRQQFMLHFIDRGNEAKRRASHLEKAGETIPEHLDPRVMFDEGNLTANRNHVLANRWHDQVMKPLEELGIPEAALGELMFFQRVLYGDRAGFANPHGVTPAEAEVALRQLEQHPNFDVLERAAQAARDLHWEVLERAVEAGIFSPEKLEALRANKNFYGAFAVVDFLQERIPADIVAQSGTFRDIANPLVATLMKTLSVNNWIDANRARAGIKQFAARYFPDELTAAARVSEEQFAPAPRGLKEFELWEDGKKVAYHVDPWIAEMFEKTSYDQLAFLARVITWADNTIFKPLWIAYNPAFQAKNIPRDLQRTSRALTAHGVYSKAGVANWLKTLWAYRKALKPAYDYARHRGNHLVEEMIENYALAPPQESMSQMLLDVGASQSQSLLRRYGGILSPGDTYQRSIPLVTKLLDFLTTSGKFLEAVPKIAAYQLLEGRGLSKARQAHIVRTDIGTPNYRIRGSATSISNATLVFSNIFAQGWRSDMALAFGPKTRLGFALELAKGALMPKALMAMAAGGLMGPYLKSLYAGVSEYEKTQYVVLPLGFEEGGEFPEGRVRRIRIPHDETSRLFGGIAWKLFTGPGGQKDLEDWTADMSLFLQGQLPDLGPSAGLVGRLSQMSAGVNPIDDFRGGPVVDPRDFKAGGWPRWRGWLKFETGQLGWPGQALRAYAFRDSESAPLTSWAPAHIPGLNALVGVTDAGFREQQRQAEHNVEKEKAKLKAGYGSRTRQVEKAFYRYRGRQGLTPNQQQAYDAARAFMSGPYKEADQFVHMLWTDGHQAEAKELQRKLEMQAGPYLDLINEVSGRRER